ncbi:hypothetical protein BJX64DRAFT_31595 [Aspergillus heterothallicus]
MIHPCYCWLSRLNSEALEEEAMGDSTTIALSFTTYHHSSQRRRPPRNASCCLRGQGSHPTCDCVPTLLKSEIFILSRVAKIKGCNVAGKRDRALWIFAPCMTMMSPTQSADLVRIFDCKRSFGTPWLPTSERLSAALIGQLVDSSCKVGDTECLSSTFVAIDLSLLSEFPRTIMDRASPLTWISIEIWRRVAA